MPCPALTAETASSLLSAANVWNNIAIVQGWLNGGTGGTGTDFDRVRFIHLPRPQVFGFPNDAFLGETQDVYATNRVAVTGDADVQTVGGVLQLVGSTDAEYPHRQIVFGECLDSRNLRVRIAGLSRRFRLPLYCRATINVSFAHRLWTGQNGYGGPAGQYTGYFSLWYGVPGGSVTEIVGSRRHTFRTRPANYEAGLNPYLVHQNMLGSIDTSEAPAKPEDIEVFVAFTAVALTNFFSNPTINTKNRNRLDILNTSMCVRVYKDYAS